MKRISRWFWRLLSLILGLAIINVPGVNAQESPPSSSGDETNSEVLKTYKQMTLEQLMNQQVTSVAKEPEPYKQAAASIDVITSDEIRRSGASSLPEALRLADNLDVAQLSSSQWDISARGFNTSGFSDKLLVLMDGRSIYSPLLAGVIWNLQDYLLPDIDRIEVISGPGGTLWGANAVNGVINIISKDAKDTQGLYVAAGGGNWLEDYEAARYGGTITTNIYYRVYGKYFQYGAEKYPDGTSAHDSWNRGDGGFRIDAEGSPDNLFTLEGNVLGGDNDEAPGGEGTPVAEGTSSDGNISGRWTHTYSDDSDMQLQLYYDRSHLGAPFQSALGVPMGTLYDDLDTADLDFQDRFPVGQYDNVVWGLGYRFTHDLVQPAPLVDFIPNTLDQNLYSAFVQDQVKLPDNITVTAGTKLEHNDYTGFEYEPSIRAQWNFTDNQMVWGAVSRSVRMPSRYDRDLFEPTPGDFVFLGTSNSTFESETVIAYELGYRAQLSKEMSGSLTAFFNDYDHLRSLSETPKTLFPLYWSNNDKGETWGFELSADYQILDWWRLHAGYDLLQENIYAAGQDADGGFGDVSDPEHQVFLRSSMDLPHHIELDAGGRWIDQVQFNSGAAVGTVPSYFELDVRLGWHVTKNLELALAGQNLLHAQHVEAGFPNSAQEAIVRGVYGKIAWQF
jgi:iron complex outermembrane receptor protein